MGQTAALPVPIQAEERLEVICDDRLAYCRTGTYLCLLCLLGLSGVSSSSSISQRNSENERAAVYSE